MSKRFKSTTVLFVIIALAVCAFVGCSTDSSDSIIGKWYNKNGRCLDIRSDGTYKLEDDYGTGKWKLLDDKETFEFLDFYGDSQETKIYKDDHGAYVDFGHYGDFYKDSPPTSNGQSGTEKAENNTDIEILKVIETGNSFYKLEFKIADKKYCGIANVNGEIIFYTDQYTVYQGLGGQDVWKGVDYTPMSETSGCVCQSLDGKNVYTIINTDGSKKEFSDEDFDMILGAGGGYLFVYKNTGSISKEEHSYGLINSNGDWENKLTPGDKIELQSNYVYAGEKVFIYSGYRFDYYAIVFDFARNKTMGFYDCSVLSDCVNNNKFIVGKTGWSASVSIPFGSEKEEKLKDNASYMFCTDGTYQEIQKITAASGKIAVYEDSGVYHILDTETKHTTKFDAYPASSIVNCQCADNCAFFTIRGEDGNFYFTIVDSAGKQLFEPRHCISVNEIVFTGDRIIYKTKSGFFEMSDNSGNIIIPENLKCSSLTIKGSAVVGIADRNMVYFDKDGNEVSFHVK